MNRLRYLDWTRGLAVVLMIQCHTFNSLAHTDVRGGGPYVLSQFVGGMAAPLFLFMAGMTFAFQMDSLDRRARPYGERLLKLWRRAGYLFLLAFLFRLNNSLMSLPNLPWRSLLKVDILNCMGLAMAVFAPVALVPAHSRARAAAALAVLAAAVSPLVSHADWSGVPTLIHDYLVPGRNRFAFFPCGAYLAFGIAAGTVLRRAAPDRLERVMQWAVVGGLALVLAGQYFSNLPYSLYASAEFWLDSPALVAIRCGLALVLLAAAYLWTEYAAGPGWSWMESLGKTSLLVYWVHVLLVYGLLAAPWKASLPVAWTFAATVIVMALMVGLSAARLRYAARRAPPLRMNAAGAPS